MMSSLRRYFKRSYLDRGEKERHSREKRFSQYHHSDCDLAARDFGNSPLKLIASGGIQQKKSFAVRDGKCGLIVGV